MRKIIFHEQSERYFSPFFANDNIYDFMQAFISLLVSWANTIPD